MHIYIVRSIVNTTLYIGNYVICLSLFQFISPTTTNNKLHKLLNINIKYERLFTKARALNVNSFKVSKTDNDSLKIGKASIKTVTDDIENTTDIVQYEMEAAHSVVENIFKD